MQEDLTIREINGADKEWMKKFMIDEWGSEIIVASEDFNSLELPGLVAESNGKIEGLLTYNINKNKLEIVSINAMIKGKGVGSALIEKSKEIANEQNLESVWLETSNDNIDALKFYQKRGFRIVKVYPGAIDEARKRKPSIPEIGNYGIPLKDSLELEYKIEKNI